MLKHLVQSLRAQLVRPINCAIVCANLSLIDFIGCPAELINQIDIDPPAWDKICDPQDLEIYPTGWADLIIVDLAVFADIHRDRLWSEMVRIAAGQGLMLALLPASRELSMIHSCLAMVQGALAPYVQSYGTDPWSEGPHSVHWALRNTRNFNSVAVLSSQQDLHARGLNDLIVQVSSTHDSLKLSPLVEPLLEPDSGQAENGLFSMEPVSLNADVDEKEASICRLQQQLDERTEACRQAEVELHSLRSRYTALRAALAVADRAEQRDEVPDQDLAQTELNEQARVHDKSLTPSVEPVLLAEVDAGPADKGTHSTQLISQNALITELEASIGRLQAQLNERTEASRLGEVELQGLRHRHTELWGQLVMVGDRSEQQRTITDEAVAENAALRHQLSEMTASYVEMRDTVQGLITSRFWRITSLPRRLLDRLRICFPSGNVVERPILEDHVQIAPELAISPVGCEQSSDQSNTGHDDSLSWRKLWTGSFLNARDNSSATSQYRLDRILFVDWRLPEPDQDSGSCRIIAILEMAILLGFRVDFISDADNQGERYHDLLLGLGIHVITGRTRALRHLQRFGCQYRKCFVSRPETASFYFPLIRCFCPEAELIYDTVDLHYSRFYRGSQLSSHDVSKRLDLLNLHYQYKSAEFFLAKSADRIVVVTESEKSELSVVVSSESIVVLPNVHPVPDFCSLPAWEKRQDILFVGGFDHEPNVDAVIYFCEHILPLVVEELPDVVFHVVGSNMPEHIFGLRSPHVNPVGYVADLREVFDRVRVFVAPLRYGAGLKGKVGQSMSFGVPVVGTSIAFEGFSLVDHHEGIIANDPEIFAQSVVNLFVDHDLWLSISTNAWRVIEERFSTQAVRQCVQSLLQASST